MITERRITNAKVEDKVFRDCYIKGALNVNLTIMSRRISILWFNITLLSAFVLMSCSTNTENQVRLQFAGEWQQSVLVGTAINSITKEGGSLFFSASNGLYVKDASGFQEFGFQGEPVKGLVQLSGQEYIAALQAPYIDRGDTTLFKTSNGGKDWTPYLSNYGGKDNTYTFVNCITNNPTNPSLIYTCGAGNVARSEDGGNRWDSIYLTWEHLGEVNFVKANPGNNQIVWAGGINAIFEPKLVRSADGGETWTNLSENLQIKEGSTFEAVAYDLSVNKAETTSHLLIGLTVGVFKSVDNGETWNTVLEEYGIYTFTQSNHNPEIVYASGGNSTGTLFFLASNDFGDTWQTIAFEDSPGDMYVNDMISVQENGEEVLYLGTNKGVYSYTFKPN